jgi:hypothetical protein
VDAEPEPRTDRGRPALPLAVPLLLALTAWGFALCPRGSNPPCVEDPLVGELRRFRVLTEPAERVQVITRLGPVRDPRVTVALMEVVQAELGKNRTGATDTPPVLLAAAFALFEYHIPEDERVLGVKYWTGAIMWWETHEAAVRGRAALLPQ